ncbi:unnamed protein product [Microthlaspi erraticum]|uniref:Uncharacterized protein n=1 Tax=Microthlaspi erraticum TaxID=1685480 RepID=A0A6D2I5Z7_9BRAS|nr:unnamed protein product [Microthlaspi erraticum]
MDPKQTMDRYVEKFKEAYLMKDFDTCLQLVSQIKALLHEAETRAKENKAKQQISHDLQNAAQVDKDDKVPVDDLIQKLIITDE